MEAIILAGGLGTRLKGYANGLPKPMVDISGRPFLEIIMDKLVSANFQRVCLAVSYKAQKIIDHFGCSYKGMDVIYSKEKIPLGTGGAIKQAITQLGSTDIFILNGDTIVDVDYSLLLGFHKKNKADLSITIYKESNYDRYGTVITNQQDRVIDFIEKQTMAEGSINAGVYIIDKTLLEQLSLPDMFSFENDLMEKEVANIKEYAFSTDGYFIDIGIPEDLERAREELS